jgi:hypothetical protein
MQKDKLRQIMYIGFVCAALVVGIHWVANENALYWVFHWLDIPMHIAGGFTAAMGSIWLIETIRYGAKLSVERGSQLFVWGISGAFVVGLLWEFLEMYYGLSGFSGIYRIDTIADLINDMIGGVFGVIYWKLLIK